MTPQNTITETMEMTRREFIIYYLTGKLPVGNKVTNNLKINDK